MAQFARAHLAYCIPTYFMDRLPSSFAKKLHISYANMLKDFATIFLMLLLGKSLNHVEIMRLAGSNIKFGEPLRLF